MKAKTYRIIVFLCCLMTVPSVLAEGIVINHASSRLVDDVYQMDAKLEFNFDPEMIDALEHGVSISIDLDILIKRERNWLWDPKIKEETLSFRLEQHPLSNLYLVTNLKTNNRRQFKTLEEALDFLGTIHNYFLVSQSVLAKDEKYRCMIKAELNTETLPPVIRPIAAVSKKWQLDSPWYEWVINK